MGRRFVESSSPSLQQADRYRIVLKEIEQGEVTRKQRKKKPTEPNQESAVKSTTTPVEPVNIGQPSQPSSAAGFY